MGEMLKTRYGGGFRAALIFLLCLLVAGPGWASVRDAAITQDKYGRILTAVYIGDDGPYRMLLDTGAGRTSLDPAILRPVVLGLAPSRYLRVFSATGESRAPIYRLDAVRALGVRRQIAGVVAFPSVIEDSKGVLGTDFLLGYILRVDPSVNAARLYSNSVEIDSEEGWSVFQGRPVNRGSLAIDIQFGDVAIPAIVDSGASHSVVNEAALKYLIDNGLFAVSEGQVTVAATGGTNKGVIIKRADTTFPDDGVADEWRIDQLVAADLPVFTRLGADQVPAMLLGMDQLGQHEFAIDFRQWRLLRRMAGR